MNKVFDYQGTFVSQSQPAKQLRLVKKTVLIDSSDRDTTKYYTNGDVVYYLPRIYENVVCISLKSGTFPRLVDETSEGALTHSYINGQNVSSSVWGSDVAVTNEKYFLMELEGLNKHDETAVSAQRSTFTDNFFAKIPCSLSHNTAAGYFIEYNNNTFEENNSKYLPPIGKLDRIRVVTRLHSQQNKSGFIYWTSDGAVASGSNQNARLSDYSIVLELTMLDNGFDDFSALETRLSHSFAEGYKRI